MVWLVHILVNAVTLMIIAHFFASVTLSGFGAAILASIILGIVNMIVKPILVILTLPVTVLTLGLFLFVINAITLLLTSAVMGDNFSIDSFGMAVVAAVIFAILSSLIHSFIIDPLTKR
ncbi:phage holin family protein [Salisediminibacterium halotolerans]|uniref:phage holin family protein n=1 Tax=Salisediminibacterium halotolerans TaxID=517425 RepID=UPI000EAF7F4D|nr:phage holin family protein [Salisediminibacterium halotolerans]RLJ75467.1 putative membrane protein [Actinophytocola xinjiangensis]RPE89320.1 putative membrane protein [Salisediminibacterium halotolerans]TWG36080.1 putative membrane protein [Salisediminibacterium halotolerans]GEL07843.1 putative membrane protein YvlD [Salisediminibacterium halotolerans]